MPSLSPRSSWAPSARLMARTLALVALCGAAAAHADDDWRKLRDRKPPVNHPPVTGDAAADLVGGRGTRGMFDASGATLLAWLPLNTFPGNPQAGNDCWGYTSPSGREYAIMGLYNGFGFVEVTDPSNPVLIGHVSGPNSTWHDIKVIGHYAYGVSEGGAGIQIIDLSDIDNGTVRHVRNWTTGGYSTTHNIAANPDSNHLYLCGANVGNGGLVAVDVSDPENPVMRGAWSTQYVHDAQIVTYTDGPYAGREIAFCSAAGPYYGLSTGMAIVDFTNKSSPVTLANISYPGIAFGHQCWLSADRRYLYLGDELDGPGQGVPSPLTRVFDVTDLANPVLVDTFSTPGNPSIDHNLYTKGDFIYEANYTSGLRVFNASNPSAPFEVAYFDTHPESNDATFNGAWSTYPYFASGTVLISDMERGLFIVRVDGAVPGSLDFEFPAGVPEILMPDTTTPVAVEVTANEITLDPTSVVLHASIDGAPAVQVPLAHAGDDLFIGDIPAAPCAGTVSFWFTARATDDRTFSSPRSAPMNVYEAQAQAGETILAADDFETDRGWTVQNTQLTGGAWTRVDPRGTGAQPEDDFDASGTRCYVTGQGPFGGGLGDADVDGGPTRLISPTYDLAGVEHAQVRYARWFSNDDGDDRLTIEVSNNNGASWVTVEQIAGTPGWELASFNVEDFVTPTAQVRVRFSTSDNPNNSVTEAAIDAVSIVQIECQADCRADFDGSGDLTLADFVAFRNAYTAGNMSADFDGSGALTLADFVAFRNAYTAGCP